MHGFAEQYFRGAWESFVEVVNPRGDDTAERKLWSASIEVKTRQLHTDATVTPNFDRRVPEHEIAKKQDLYPLGWLLPGLGLRLYRRVGDVGGELQAKPFVTENIRFPARCVPLVDLHDIRQLARYCRSPARAR